MEKNDKAEKKSVRIADWAPIENATNGTIIRDWMTGIERNKRIFVNQYYEFIMACALQTLTLPILLIIERTHTRRQSITLYGMSVIFFSALVFHFSCSLSLSTDWLWKKCAEFENSDLRASFLMIYFHNAHFKLLFNCNYCRIKMKSLRI